MNSYKRLARLLSNTCAPVLVIGLLWTGNTASAAMLPISVFSGDSSESFEDVPLGVVPGGAANLAGPVSVLEGVGILSGTNAVTYPLYVWNSIGGLSLGGGVSAVPYDGTNGLVNNSLTPVARIDFTVPVTKFGGYWGSAFNSAINFTFFDNSGSIISTDTVTYGLAGPLEWFGWMTDIGDPAIAAVEWTGHWATVDGLQVNATAVPAPGAIGLFTTGLLGLLCMANRRRRPLSA